MNNVVRMLSILTAAFLIADTTSGSATEIRLRPQCTLAGTVVTLGDLADVVSNDSQRNQELAATELFPTPLPGEQKFANVREIEDLLLLRGVRVTDLQFSGSNQVLISRTASRKIQMPKITKSVAPLNPQNVDRSVSDAIVQHLAEKVSATAAWKVEVQLPDEQVRLLSEPGANFTIRGGKAPFTGSQQFELTVTTLKGTRTFPALATVHSSAPCVVAMRTLPHGTVIREGDVQIQQAADSGSNAVFQTIDEVIGHETTRGLTAGKPVTPDDLRTPLVVHRGDVVTVYVNSGGVRIRTIARAKAEGSVGELIAVESTLTDRANYYARVSGVRTVEVFALAPQAERLGN